MHRTILFLITFIVCATCLGDYSVVAQERASSAGGLLPIMQGWKWGGFARKVGSKRKILRVHPLLNSIGSTDFDFAGKASSMQVSVCALCLCGDFSLPDVQLKVALRNKEKRSDHLIAPPASLQT
jgi:hypothetical protein